MTTDDFTQAADDAASRTGQVFIGSNDAAYGYSCGFTAGAEWARAYLTLQEPGVQHLWRPGATPRAFCGDESAKQWVPVTREESLAVPVCALCHQRAMHESYYHWAAQEPTDAEKDAAMDALGCELRVVENGQSTCELHGGYATSDDVCEVVEGTLSAARAARRDKEKR